MKKNKKYQLLDADTITIKHPISSLPVKLYRIISLESFKLGKATIEAGTIGGYIQKEANLDINDSSWVSNSAKVFDDAFVSGGSHIYGMAAVFGKAVVRDTTAGDFSRIYGNATVDRSNVRGKADIRGNAVANKVYIDNAAVIDGNAKVNDSNLGGGSHISDNSTVTKSKLYDHSRIYGWSTVTNCKLQQSALVRDEQRLNETISRQIQLNFESHNE